MFKVRIEFLRCPTLLEEFENNLRSQQVDEPSVEPNETHDNTEINKTAESECPETSQEQVLENNNEEAIKVPNRIGFARGLKAERVLGAVKTSLGLMLVMKWKGMDKCELVPANEANLNCPELVIRYYEENTS